MRCKSVYISLYGLLKYLGDNSWARVLEVTLDGFKQEGKR